MLRTVLVCFCLLASVEATGRKRSAPTLLTRGQHVTQLVGANTRRDVLDNRSSGRALKQSADAAVAASKAAAKTAATLADLVKKNLDVVAKAEELSKAAAASRDNAEKASAEIPKVLAETKAKVEAAAAEGAAEAIAEIKKAGEAMEVAKSGAEGEDPAITAVRAQVANAVLPLHEQIGQAQQLMLYYEQKSTELDVAARAMAVEITKVLPIDGVLDEYQREMKRQEEHLASESARMHNEAVKIRGTLAGYQQAAHMSADAIAMEADLK